MPSTPPAAPIDHYENFPVASWLCPRALRAPIAALYHFARTADDLADEGTASASERLADLAAYGQALQAAARGAPAADGRWPRVFGPLAVQMQAFALPLAPLQDLLSAFRQDVEMTAAGAAYADWPQLLDYCRRSANPVGRLLLHLYGVTGAQAVRESDAVCTALQLINFWQDLSVDIPRGRFYLPLAECRAHGIDISDPARQFAQLQPGPATAALLAAVTAQARTHMAQGAPLVHRIPGRAGWELRAVVQGALRVLDKVEVLGATALHQRPRLRRADAPRILWHMLRMGQSPR